MKKMTKNKPINTLSSMNEAEADYHFSAWVGAIFFYLIHFRQEAFSYYEEKKFQTRNLWVGYFLKLAVVAFLLFLAVKYLA